MKEGLLAFKYLEGNHSGENLSKCLIDVLEDYEIADRLLGITADNASNNTKMIYFVVEHYAAHYPGSAFSAEWNQIECMAHVINLGA